MGVVDDGVVDEGSDMGVGYGSGAREAEIWGFGAKFCKGDLSRPGEVDAWEVAGCGLYWPLERRRKLLRPLARRSLVLPFRLSSEFWRDDFPLARQENASISCWIGRKAYSQTCIISSISGGCEGNCCCWAKLYRTV